MNIQITETEITDLDDVGIVKAIKNSGVMKVINPSPDHRLWNLKLNLAGTDFTSLKKEAAKETLEPSKEWEFLYDISNTKAPILKLSEVFDTSKNAEGVNHNYTVGNADESTILITLENVSPKPIQNIILTKQIPDYLKSVRIMGNDAGKVDLNLETKALKWEIASLDPTMKVSVKVVGNAEIKDQAIKSGNPIEVTYESDMNQRSAVVPSILTLTDTMSGVEQEEDDNKPGWWNCVVEFSNESDLELTLKNVKVLRKSATGEEALVDLNPNAIVGANGNWKHKFSVESASVPSLTSKLDFTVNYVVPTKIIGKIMHQAQTFTVLETKLTKDINPPNVKANANTDVKITNTLTNVGTAKIDKLTIKDLIPKDFEPPALAQIELKILGKTGDLKATLDTTRMKMEMVPDNKDTKVAHEIRIEGWDLNGFFEPEAKLVMTYPIIARNPQPNIVYETPVEIKTNTKPMGPGYVDKPAQVPVIGIQYVKRKVKSMKSISPAGKEGAFNIAIKITNSGGVEIENITITEEAPKAFQVGSFLPAEMKPQFVEGEPTNKIIWKIARLDPEQTVKLTYTSQGQGEYPRTEPEISFAEAESIKRDKTTDVTATGDTSVKKGDDTILKSLQEAEAKLKQPQPYSKVADILDGIREGLAVAVRTSPLFNEIMTTAREFRKLGNAMLAGEKLDAFLNKLGEWKSRL